MCRFKSHNLLFDFTETMSKKLKGCRFSKISMDLLLVTKWLKPIMNRKYKLRQPEETHHSCLDN